MRVEQAVMSVASLCLMAALAEQLLGGGRLVGSVRLLLGLEILSVALGLVEQAWRALG